MKLDPENQAVIWKFQRINFFEKIAHYAYSRFYFKQKDSYPFSSQLFSPKCDILQTIKYFKR